MIACYNAIDTETKTRARLISPAFLFFYCARIDFTGPSKPDGNSGSPALNGFHVVEVNCLSADRLLSPIKRLGHLVGA